MATCMLKGVKLNHFLVQHRIAENSERKSLIDSFFVTTVLRDIIIIFKFKCRIITGIRTGTKLVLFVRTANAVF